VLSRRFPRLIVRLSTHCLDGSDVVGFLIQGGKVRRWELPRRRREFHWDRARREYGLVGEAAYDDDEAELFAEDGMRDEALDHWEAGTPRREVPRRRRQWWNRQVARDFMTEREIDLIQVGELLRAEGKHRPAHRRSRRTMKAANPERGRS
jgi:hypothetical protein